MSLKSDANEIGLLVSYEGWRIYEKELQDAFDKEYEKLRKCPRDSAFYKTQGFLDGLEYALKIPDILKSRGEL